MAAMGSDNNAGLATTGVGDASRSVTRTAEAETTASSWGVVTVAPGLPLRDPDRYEVLGEHGRGGLGRVLRVRDRELGRVVAVKELIDDDAGAENRFVREIKLTARLEHPGIVPVHDAGRRISDGRSFYTMKLVAGASLKEVAAGARTLGERLALMPHLLAVAEAVAYAHSEDVIHRDLKPSNVIVGEFGETIVIDWGLAKDTGEGDDPSPPAAGDSTGRGRATTSDVTAAGAILGTPVFMAPEQARGEAVDGRADVYALGAMGYFLVTGKAPYEGDSSAQVLKRVVTDPPVPLRVREPRVPVDLAAILEKAMAREPGDRYQTARELAGDLRRYQAGRYVEARAYAWWEPPLRWLRRRWGIAALCAAFVGLAAVGTAVAFGRELRLREVAEVERARADVQALALLEQQGRRELETGRPHRAAVFFAEALTRAPEQRSLRALLSATLAPMGTFVRTLRGHQRDVVCVAFSPDGTRLASGSSDRTVRVWSAASGAEEHVMTGHERSLEDVAWSPDGTVIASADNQNVRLWRAADGVALHVLTGGGFRVGIDRAGARVWAGGADGTVRVWSVTTGALVASAKPHDDRVSSIVFPPDGRVVTTSWDGRVIVWDPVAVAPRVVLDDHRAPVWFGSVSSDGRWLLTGDEEGAMYVRDGASLAVLHTMRVPAAEHANGGWFGADGRTIVTTSADGGIRVWHAVSGQVLRTIDAVAEGKLFDGARSEGGVVATAALRAIDVWRPELGVDYRVLAGPSDFRHADFHPGALSGDGRVLAASRIVRDAPAEVWVWDVARGEPTAHWSEPGEPYSMAINGDGSRIVVADLSSTIARLHDAGGAVVAELTGHGGRVYNVAMSADGARIATASYDRTVRQWRSADGVAVGPVVSLDVRPTAVGFDPAGRRLVVSSEDGRVSLFDAATGGLLGSFVAHPTWIQDVEFDRSGHRLVTGGRQDHTAKVWTLVGDAPAGPPVVLAGHADNLARASFSPDGTIVATVSMDDSARLWDATTGELLRTVPGASQTAAFAPDGATLYVTGTRDLAVAWHLAIDPRPAADLAAVVAAASPWRLDQGRLRLRAPVAP
jgi:WD40 repeat protein